MSPKIFLLKKKNKENSFQRAVCDSTHLPSQRPGCRAGTLKSEASLSYTVGPVEKEREKEVRMEVRKSGRQEGGGRALCASWCEGAL